MEFGAFVPQGWRLDLIDIPVERQWDTMVAVATVAEETGYDSVWVYDHFHTFPGPTTESTFEAWTAMAGLAEATERVRLGQMCTANSYRTPGYLAKVTSSIDVMSGGRLELGIGAGWYEAEYLGFGYPFPKPSVRIGQLDEAVQIIRSMWMDETTTFTGKHYELQNGHNYPKPLQDPHPPLWIAGGGEQLTLRVVAKYADYANYFGDDDTFRHKTAVLEEHCRDVGRNFDEITLTRNMDCVIAETEAEAEAKLDRWIDTLPEAHGAARRTNAVVGTPEQIAARVAHLRELGIDYVIVYFPDATWGDGMRVFGEHVVPEFK
jgi:F420-dependent oxidoreductase-like protein